MFVFLFACFQSTYISWFGGEMVTGPKAINRTFTLSEIPVYVRAGSIIAMRTDDFGQSAPQPA